MNAMKILHLIPDLNLTCGISKTIYRIAKNSSDEFQHFVLTFGGDAMEKFRKAGIPVHVMPFSKNFDEVAISFRSSHETARCVTEVLDPESSVIA